MSFCFLYNVVLENHSVQNSPWGGGGGGSIASSRSIKFSQSYNCFPFRIKTFNRDAFLQNSETFIKI